ncbi:hypothetical protein D3C78_1368570 [compost metagenome]
MNGLDDGQERHVEAQHAIFGVADDPGDLIGVQTRIDGVQHPARAAHAEIHLHVAVAIPGQAGHALALRQTHGIDGIGQLLGAGRQVAVGVAVEIAFDAARNDLCIAVVAGCKIDQRRNQQRLALHQSQHEKCSFGVIALYFHPTAPSWGCVCGLSPMRRRRNRYF